MKKLSWVFAVVMIIGLLMVSLKPAKASLLTFELGQGLITATFNDDFGGNDSTVRLTMATDNLAADEFVSDWYFNFDPDLDPTLLLFTAVDVYAEPNEIKTGDDAFKAASYGDYDILFDFPPPPGKISYKFIGGEIAIYDITYTSPIEVSSFNFESSIVDGHFMSAAHYQGSSGIISTPDASIMFLLGPSLIALGLFSRKKSRK